MFLAVDIGNTAITFGIFYGRDLKKRFVLPAKKNTSKEEYNKSIEKLRLKYRIPAGAVSGSIISSVVPELTGKIERSIKNIYGIKPKILGKDISVPIKNLYRKPKEVGQDRLVNSYAANIIYGPGDIVVDYGTAITFDIVSKESAYIGGIIVPGIEISLNALIEKASLLPEIDLKNARRTALIGKKTAGSMKSGIFFGFGALTDGLISQLKAELKFNPRVIATGGYSKIISAYCKSIDLINPDLTLQGISLIHMDKIAQ